MADEQTNESQPEPVTEPIVTSGVEQGENQQVQNVESAPAPDASNAAPAGDKTEPTQKEEPFEWDGNVDALPKELQSRGKGMLQYMHKVTQEASQVKNDAKGFQELINHPEFKEFLDWQDKKGKNPTSNQPPQQTPQQNVELTEDELIAAQSDPSKFSGLLNNRVSNIIQPMAEQVMDRMAKMERSLNIDKQERNVEAFAKTHSDFWQINPVVMKAAMQTTHGQGIEAAYNQAKVIEKQYYDKAQASMAKKVSEKKAAVSATPSASMSPKVIYVDNKGDADRVAYEQALLGKRVDVRVKKK